MTEKIIHGAFYRRFNNALKSLRQIDTLGLLDQGHLFDPGPKTQLEKIPYKFQYKFWCDDQLCPGHTIICTDWEMGHSWRKWRDQYGEDGWKEKFLERYERDMIEKYDTHFYVGTVHQHPDTWIIVGLFYPPPSAPSLFTIPDAKPFQSDV